MPLLIQPRWPKALHRLAILTVVATFAGTGAAAAACPAQPTTTPFSPWSDSGDYFLIPGGSFEGTGGQTGWKLDGATLTAGNEPFYVNASGDRQSLLIGAGGRAKSPVFCLDAGITSLRFFVTEATPGSDLQVKLITWSPGSNAGAAVYDLADLADGSMPAWAPTAPSDVGTALNIPAGQWLDGVLRLDVPGTAGAWQVDDVYADPYRGG